MTSSASFQPRVVLGASLIVRPSSRHFLILAVDFVNQGLFDGPKAVQILDLDDRRRDRLAVLRDVKIDVGVAPQRAFLHLAVGDFQVAQSQLQLFQAATRIGRRADVGLGDDFEQRNARAVQVDLGKAAVAVGQLAGIFLEMDPRQAAPAAAAAILANRDLEMAASRKRQVVLADLIVFGQVRIVVVLPVPLGERRDLGVQAHRRFERQLKCLAVHHRQRARQARARPGRSACWAAGQSRCRSTRTSCSRSEAARGSQGR